MIKVGDKFTSNRGDVYVVVKYINRRNITIEFCDKHKHRLTTDTRSVRVGNVKNPYHPKLFGIGYFGVGEYKSKNGSAKDGHKSTPAYQAWANMLSRCYDKNYRQSYLYEKVEVCEDWHCFQTFAEWYYNELSQKEWETTPCVDKDVLGNSLLYSPNTCCLLPRELNIIINEKKTNSKYLRGVIKSTKGLYSVSSMYDYNNLRFESELDAHLYFVEAKINRLREVIEKCKHLLKPEVYEVLITKDFRHKFSTLF